MTRVEKLRHQQELIARELEKAERCELAERLRKSFAQLAEDDSLPILDLLESTLKMKNRRGNEPLEDLASVLELAIKTHSDTSSR